MYEAHKGTIPENMVIDHIDNNPNNNNIENLRLASLSQNQFNRKVNKNNKLGIKNISIETRTKNPTYSVRINKKKKQMYCKNFKTLEEAIEYKKIKLQELHGEFANID